MIALVRPDQRGYTEAMDIRPRTTDGRVYLRYSSVISFQTCHRRYYWEHLEGLEPAYFAPSDPRTWGTAVHEALQPCWAGEPEQALPAIDAAFPLRDTEYDAFTAWARASSAMAGYLRRWADERDVECAPGTLVALEAPFEGPLLDSRGRASERYAIQGRLDGAWWVDGVNGRASWGEMELSSGLYVVEHKTASRIDGPYLDRVWSDFQTQLYSDMAERALETPVAGVLYDVIGKTRLEHKRPESTEAWEVRRAEAQVAALDGRLGKRLRLKRGETVEAFHARRVAHGLQEVQRLARDTGEPGAVYLSRLDEYYARPEAYARIATSADRARRLSIVDNLVHVADEIAYCESTGRWPQSLGACRTPGRVCDFVDICESGDDDRIIEQNYRVKGTHHHGLPAGLSAQESTAVQPEPATAGAACTGT